jgi:hypothetical protein
MYRWWGQGRHEGEAGSLAAVLLVDALAGCLMGCAHLVCCLCKQLDIYQGLYEAQ